MKKIQRGDTVTCKVPQEGHYSRYAGNPLIEFRPGMEGIVAHPDTASVHYFTDCVTGKKRQDSGVTVDFVQHGKMQRVFLHKGNVVKIERA